MDEVGRGSLAGPVLAAAVVLKSSDVPEGIRDSKMLSPTRRSNLFRAILRAAEMWSVGAASALEIDTVNILEATRRAMTRAVEGLPRPPDHLLIDALRLPDVPIDQTAVMYGDRICLSIAAASIVAKVTRDRIMEEYGRRFPAFGFSSNKGYGTRDHLEAVGRLGACPIHRRTFHGIWVNGLLPFTDPETSTPGWGG